MSFQKHMAYIQTCSNWFKRISLIKATHIILYLVKSNYYVLTGSILLFIILQAFFQAFGPAFKQQESVDSFENIEVYNLLART